MSNEAETMKQKSKRTLTPKLRFPEFRGAGEWEEVPLEQIAERVKTKNLDGSIARVLTNSAEHGILDQRDYFDKDIANAGNIDGYYIVDLGDYVYNPRISTLAPVGPISRNNIGKGVMSPLYTVFRFTEENTDFYKHYFKTASWHLYLKRVSSMGARHDRMSITTGDFMAMPVPTPLPQEQQKIAECLGSLDGVIAAEDRKLAALRDHKRGLMQQLFPQPGQTQPRRRFPEFRDKGEWENKTLGEVADYENGKAHEQDINEHGKYIVVNSRFISTEGEVIKYSNSLNLAANKDDILMVLSDVPKGRAIARCFLVDEDDKYTVNQRICKITAKSAVSVLVFYILDRNTYFLAFDDGVKQTNLKKEDVLQCPIMLPKDKEEQQRIADCLTALDTLIKAQAAKIDALKQHKSGLKQQLFPAPAEESADA